MDTQSLIGIGSAIASTVSTGVLAFIWMDVRKVRTEQDLFVKEQRAELERIADRHHECQRELPERFARREDIAHIHERIDHAEGSVNWLKGKLNGAAAN
jgi:hypothetical protein